MRAVIDTNVILSGLYFGGAPLRIIELVEVGLLTPCYNEKTWEELEAVLFRKKFARERKLLTFSMKQFMSSLKEYSHFVLLPDPIPNVIPEDPADNYVIVVAIESNAECIISGDAHLLRLGSYKRVPILKPKEFLELLER